MQVPSGDQARTEILIVYLEFEALQSHEKLLTYVRNFIKQDDNTPNVLFNSNALIKSEI